MVKCKPPMAKAGRTVVSVHDNDGDFRYGGESQGCAIHFEQEVDNVQQEDDTCACFEKPPDETHLVFGATWRTSASTAPRMQRVRIANVAQGSLCVEEGGAMAICAADSEPCDVPRSRTWWRRLCIGLAIVVGLAMSVGSLLGVTFNQLAHDHR